MSTTERHDIVLGVQADVTRARAELEALEKIALRLRSALGGGSGGGPGMPVGIGGGSMGMPAPPPPGSPGGAPGMSNSSTVSSGQAVAAPGVATTTGYVPHALPARDASGRFVSASGGGGGGAATQQYVPPSVQSGTVITNGSGGGGGGSGGGGGGTRSSGSLWSSAEIAGFARQNQGADDQTKRLPDPNGGGGSGGGGYGYGNIGAQGIRSAASGIASGSVGGMFSAGTGFIAGAVGGGMLGSAIQALGTISGLGTKDENTAERSRLERRFGKAQLAGFGRDTITTSPVYEWSGDPAASDLNTVPFAYDPMSRWYGSEHQKLVRGKDFTRKTEDGLSAWMEKAAAKGIEPGEAVEMATEFTRSVGGRVKGDRSNDILKAINAGISSSTMGGFDRQQLFGRASGPENAAIQLAGIGQKGFGAYGDLDGWMRSLSSNIDRLINRGMKIDTNETIEFMSRMANTPGLGGLGDRAPAVYAGFKDAASAAGDQLTNPFRGLMQKAALMTAMQGGGDIFDVFSRTREMKATDVQGAVNSFGSLPASMAYLSEMPMLQTDEAKRLASGDLSAGKDFKLEEAGLWERMKIIAERKARNLSDPTRIYSEQRQKEVSDMSEDASGITTHIATGIWLTKDLIAEILAQIKEGRGIDSLDGKRALKVFEKDFPIIPSAENGPR